MAEINDDVFVLWADLHGFHLPDMRQRIAALQDADLAARLSAMIEEARESASVRLPKGTGKTLATRGAAAMLGNAEAELQEEYRRRREAFLLPLARTGNNAKQQRSRAGFTSGEEREAERKQVWDQWQAMADDIYRKNPTQSKQGVCDKVAVEFGVTGRAVAKRVKIIGTERPRSRK